MSVVATDTNCYFNYTNYLFNDPLNKEFSLINRVANIAFHVLTLCIPLVIYHAISYSYSKSSLNSSEIAAKQNETISDTSTEKDLKLDVEKYRQNKFHYTREQLFSNRNLFELQSTITLPIGTAKFEVDMDSEGRVEQVSSNSVFIYTDYLGPCVAAIGRCKTADSSMLIGVTHLYAENEDFEDNLAIEVSAILEVNRTHLADLNVEKIIQHKQFKQQKLNRLIDEFSKHPSYNGETIELFFAGGNGNLLNELWRKLTVEYAKNIPNVTVVGTYFNCYQATEEIQKKIEGKKIKLWFMAGITNHGAILLHKSHSIDFHFQASNFDSL